jgi:hypothetical protein
MEASIMMWVKSVWSKLFGPLASVPCPGPAVSNETRAILLELWHRGQPGNAAITVRRVTGKGGIQLQEPCLDRLFRDPSIASLYSL